MNSTTNKNIILHRSSRRINRPALSVPVSRADSEKSATAHTLTHPYPLHTNHLQTTLSSCSFFSNSISQTTQGKTSPVPPVSLTPTNAPSSPLMKPRKDNNIGAFSVRTLAQIGQQASLAITLSSLNVVIYCVWETQIQDSSAVLQLSCLNTAGRTGVGFTLSNRAYKALIYWIPVNGRMCAARFSSSVNIGHNRLQKRTLRCATLCPNESQWRWWRHSCSVD